jgi:hypothetical protein
MDYVKDKLNQVSESMQGETSKAAAEGDKRKFDLDSSSYMLL